MSEEEAPKPEVIEEPAPPPDYKTVQREAERKLRGKRYRVPKGARLKSTKEPSTDDEHRAQVKAKRAAQHAKAKTRMEERITEAIDRKKDAQERRRSAREKRT